MEGNFGLPLEAVIIFLTSILFFSFLDLKLSRHRQNITSAIIWSIIWFLVAIFFYWYIKLFYSTEYASLFLSGYFLEESLSIDNLMVFIAIFSSFGIKDYLQHKILYFGILGAILFRLIFVLFGTSLFFLSHWVELVFSIIVAWTGFLMLSNFNSDNNIDDYSQHWSVIITKKIIPIFPHLYKDHFFITRKQLVTISNDHSIYKKSIFYATPMFLCLVVVEISDIIFAFDSVPAVIAITREPFLVYSAVIFAILGLRSLYFILSAAQKYLIYLGKAVATLLFFISFKLCIQALNKIFGWPNFDISTNISLLIIVLLLSLGVITSIIFPNNLNKN